MNEANFTVYIGRIYASFGKNMPSQAIRDAIFRRVEKFPEAFMAYAEKRLIEQESLPQNLGRYLEQELWPDYKNANPLVGEWRKQESCPLCHPAMPGFRRVYSADFSDCFLWKCPCNTDAHYAGQIAWTDELIAQHGLHTYQEWLEWIEENPPKYAGKYLRVIGHSEPIRPRHAKVLQELEEQW